MSNNLTHDETLNLFSAENVLSSSPIIQQVLALRDTISRDSEGTEINYDDMYLRIQNEADKLPSLELQMDIAPGMEGAYQRQLILALDQINGEHDRVLRKIGKLKSRVVNCVNLMNVRRAQFAAWYALGIPTIVQTANIKGLKLSVKHINEIADGEFSRLMDALDQATTSLINELEILEEEVKGRKKAQAVKYQLGKDQVNAMWESITGQSSGIGTDDNLSKLITVETGDDEEVPAFVSKHSKATRVMSSSSYLDSDVCSICGEKQVDTPSGIVCSNGHGGAPSVADAGVIKGTFKKLTGYKKATPVVDEDGEVITLSVDELTELIENNSPRKNLIEEWITAGGELNKPRGYEPEGKEVFTPTNGQSIVIAGPVDIPAATCIRPVQKDDLPSPSDAMRIIDSIVSIVKTQTTKAVLIEDIEDVDFGEPSDYTYNPPELTEEPLVAKPKTNIIPADEIEDLLNEPLASVSPTTPRKKLMLFDEEDIL